MSRSLEKISQMWIFHNKCRFYTKFGIYFLLFSRTETASMKPRWPLAHIGNNSPGTLGLSHFLSITCVFLYMSNIMYSQFLPLCCKSKTRIHVLVQEKKKRKVRLHFAIRNLQFQTEILNFLVFHFDFKAFHIELQPIFTIYVPIYANLFNFVVVKMAGHTQKCVRLKIKRD